MLRLISAFIQPFYPQLLHPVPVYRHAFFLSIRVRLGVQNMI